MHRYFTSWKTWYYLAQKLGAIGDNGAHHEPAIVVRAMLRDLERRIAKKNWQCKNPTTNLGLLNELRNPALATVIWGSVATNHNTSSGEMMGRSSRVFDPFAPMFWTEPLSSTKKDQIQNTKRNVYCWRAAKVELSERFPLKGSNGLGVAKMRLDFVEREGNSDKWELVFKKNQIT